MFDAIEIQYEADPAALEIKYQPLLPYIQKAIANYAIFLYVNIGGVNLNNAGISVQSSQNSQPAPQWKIDKLEKSLLASADRHAEKLLAYLEKNKDEYPLWVASPSYTLSKDLFINSADELSKYISINNSRRLFLKLKKYLFDVEELHIKRLICKDQYAALKIESPTQPSLILLNKLKPLVARLALLQGIPELRISITDQGINVLSYSDSINIKGGATDAQINDLKESLKSKIEAHTEEVKFFLEENLADYPLYANRPCYAAKPVPGPGHIPVNDPCGKSFSV